MKKIILMGLLLQTLLTHPIPSMETAAEYQKNEQFAQAIACYEDILQHDPINLNAYFQAGCCYLAIGDKEKTINAFTKILEFNPDLLSVKYNLAYAHKTFGDLDTAIAMYQEIIAIDPTYDQAQLGLGFAYVTRGNLQLGWQQHKRYLIQSGKNGDKLRQLLEDDDIVYKTIVLSFEGGLGDTLNFIRYAQELKNMGTNIIVSCQPQLIPLLSRCSYIDQLIPSGKSVPAHDAQATLMTLPAIFSDAAFCIPNEIPYLFADPALTAHWRQQLAHDTNFKVGICWQVDAHNDLSKLPIGRRGYPLEQFAVLGDLENVSFYSLQKYDGVEQLTAVPSHFTLRVLDDLDEHAGPFMDTAALINNLDLVITVDTATAHLAGALGCKVWLLHPYATADWRWIHGRTDSYWYPTMRIFRQHEPFGYETVLQEVKNELSKLTQ